MDQLGAISMFVATADQGSFTRAAACLGKTTSALTKAVTHLETQLGTRLFERSTRRIALTEAGHLYLASARQVLFQLQQAQEHIDQLQQEMCGTLRLVAPPSFAPAFLNAVCYRFLELYPQMRLEVELTDEFVDLLAGGYDLAVRDGPVDLPDLIARPLTANRILLCASPRYLQRKPLAVTPQTFHEHDWLIFRHPALNPHFWRFSLGGQQHRVAQPVPRLASDNYDFLFGALLAGLGLQLCPQWSAAPYLQRGELVQLLPEAVLDPEQFGPRIHAIYPVHRRQTRKHQAFIECLKEHLDQQHLH
ncbi:LysR family transcriptional regulator [Pseudomonas piscis]|uniref:LysR family transcriptional regulator n=1 Tax=Pseudomonas piscis TaxID=2614538 RepID=UPI0003B33C2E|nr:LysR family transcriptional regulator [Pseudomonas piscis]ERO65503.1 LysR family transcriptional regulator [Pseudomonas piscis]ERO65569.1 LysR family transcriptional regulator [Pseudomonas piscis]MCU7647176.1 LysR family transcriptional regulator [Pseudomonas piscis]